MKKIILTERSEKEDRTHQRVVRIVDSEGAWHNLGSLCLGENKASNKCRDSVHLDLRSNSGNGNRYLIGEIHDQQGDFRGTPEKEGDGALVVGSGPTAQNCKMPPAGGKSITQGRTPRGASACWAGTVYESWRSYRMPEHAVAYLKKYFEVLADGFNENYTQEWIDQECHVPSAEECAIETSTTKARHTPNLQRPTTKSVGVRIMSESPIPDGFSRTDILKEVVRWIHEKPFVRRKRDAGLISSISGAREVRGWENRVKEYAYARKSEPHFVDVYRDILPIIQELSAIRSAHVWTGTMATPPAIVVSDVAKVAEKICLWGGVVQKDYSEAWKVLRDAISGRDHGSKMNSGWTKVASFATDGMIGNEQTIWDSRVATSLIWRIDQILASAVSKQLIKASSAQSLVKDFNIGTVASLNVGTRPRTLAFNWPSGYGKWDFHFSGGLVVREIVAVLNDPANNYPRMPRPTFDAGWDYSAEQVADWTVFGVGLVLFMDGW